MNFNQPPKLEKSPVPGVENKPSEENITKEKINQAKESLSGTIKELNDSMGHLEKSSPTRIKKIIAYLKENSSDILRPIYTATLMGTGIVFAVG